MKKTILATLVVALIPSLSSANIQFNLKMSSQVDEIITDYDDDGIHNKDDTDDDNDGILDINDENQYGQVPIPEGPLGSDLGFNVETYHNGSLTSSPFDQYTSKVQDGNISTGVTEEIDISDTNLNHIIRFTFPSTAVLNTMEFTKPYTNMLYYISSSEFISLSVDSEIAFYLNGVKVRGYIYNTSEVAEYTSYTPKYPFEYDRVDITTSPILMDELEVTPHLNFFRFDIGIKEVEFK